MRGTDLLLVRMFTLVGTALSSLNALTMTLMGELDVLMSRELEVLNVPSIGPCSEWTLILFPVRS